MKYLLILLILAMSGCASGPKIMKKCTPAQDPFFICEEI